MVQDYKQRDFLSLLDYLKTNSDSDFYLTENNSRYIVNTDIILKRLLKLSREPRILYDHGDVVGIILLWKSIGNFPRYYVKISAKDENIAEKLLTVLLWNTTRELWIKIKKNSKFVKVFRNKGFDFCGDRGNEILLQYKKIRVKNDKYQSKDKEYIRR